MIAAIAKWGNSLALRIPAGFARELSVEEGAAIDISVADGVLVVRPIEESHIYDLDALLCQITEENRHGEVATGTSVGHEI